MPKAARVTLTQDQRVHLLDMIATGSTSAHALAHAHILLKADEGAEGPAWTDEAIADAFEMSVPTVARVRTRFVQEGLEPALHRRVARRHRSRKLDGEGEAHLIALVCGQPPEGQNRWSLRLIADRLVELKHVEAISHETVRRTLKKMNSSRG